MCRTCADVTRRHAMGLMAGGLTLAAGLAPARASGKAQAILLSCMDFRLVDDLVAWMDGQGLQNEYDHVVLAGAALGAVHPGFEAWHKVFWDHVGLAVKLHGIKEIVVIDHRDCGAFKLAMGTGAISTPTLETATHTHVFRTFAAEAGHRFPDLTVSGYLMALDGTVEPLGGAGLAGGGTAHGADGGHDAGAGAGEEGHG